MSLAALRLAVSYVHLRAMLSSVLRLVGKVAGSKELAQPCLLHLGPEQKGACGGPAAQARRPRGARAALSGPRVCAAEQACRRTSSSMRSSPGCPSCTSPWPRSRSPSWRPWRARPATPPATSRACRPSRSRASAWTTTRWRPAPLVALTLTLCAGACGDARALAFRARQLKRQPGGAPCLSSACHVAG